MVKISATIALDLGTKFLAPKSVPEDYCWEETDTSFVFSLSSLSELPRGAGCFCFSSLDTIISDKDTDVEDSGKESGHKNSGYLEDGQGTSLISLSIYWKAVAVAVGQDLIDLLIHTGGGLEVEVADHLADHLEVDVEAKVADHQVNHLDVEEALDHLEEEVEMADHLEVEV